MKNSIFNAVCKTRYLALLTVSLFTCVGAWGACNTYTLGWGAASGSSGTYTNFTATSGSVSNLLSFSTAKNNSGTNPAYNSTNKQLRLYYHSGGNGGSITITPVDGVTITGFVMTCATAPSVKYTVDGGTATSVTASSKVYTVSDGSIAATSSLKIQNVNTSNTQLQISTIQISYTYEPTSPTNETIGSSTAHLSWTDSHSVGKYDVYRSTTNSAPGINTTPTLSNITNKYVDLSGLSSNTTYYWWVRSNNSCKSAWIAGSSFKTSAAVTSVTASPASITFPENTVEVGTDEATSTITLSNGYASYGNYLYGWFEDLSDEDHCEFFVNEDYTYSYTTSGSASPTLTFSYLADAAGTYTGKFIIQGYNSSYTAVNCTIPLSVTLTSSCTNSVTIATGSPTNCTISASAASVSTCSGTRQVTISVTPNSCYAGPTDATIITKSGTAATLVSGPTLNSGHYDYVYSFAENATGSTTFNASLSTKTTYTVSYDKGTYGTGDNSSGTKTCGVDLTLPSSAMFTREGYTQTGWSTATAGNTKTYNLGASYTTDAATTLYPYWQVNTYTVTWKVNNTNYSAGGSTEVTHGNHVATLPTAPNPASYCGQRFMGWTTSEVVTPQAAAPSPLYTEASQFPNATGNQVFHAVFADYDE